MLYFKITVLVNEDCKNAHIKAFLFNIYYRYTQYDSISSHIYSRSIRVWLMCAAFRNETLQLVHSASTWRILAVSHCFCDHCHSTLSHYLLACKCTYYNIERNWTRMCARAQFM